MKRDIIIIFKVLFGLVLPFIGYNLCKWIGTWFITKYNSGFIVLIVLLSAIMIITFFCGSILFCAGFEEKTRNPKRR